MKKVQKVLKFGTILFGGLVICYFVYFSVMVIFAGSISSILAGIPFLSELASFHLETFHWFLLGVTCLFYATLIFGGLYSAIFFFHQSGDTLL